MAQVQVVGAEALMREFRQIGERRMPIAASWALNDMASEVLEDVQERIRREFDRPTPFAQKAFTVRGARPSKLEAEVTEKPSVGRRHFLKVQEVGGQRPATGLEGLMQSRVKTSARLEAIVPAKAAKRDKYGNWQSGERNRLLSSIQAQRDDRSNTTQASKGRNKGRDRYFVPRAGSKLSPGVYRVGAKGGPPVKILSFLSARPKYQKRLGFLEGAEDLVDARLSFHLRRTFAKMLAKVQASGG